MFTKGIKENLKVKAMEQTSNVIQSSKSMLEVLRVVGGPTLYHSKAEERMFANSDCTHFDTRSVKIVMWQYENWIDCPRSPHH